VLMDLEYSPVSLASNPASPLDPWRLSRALGKLTKKDLFYSPGYNSPLLSKASFVFSVHDLNHIDSPEIATLSKRVYYATVMKRACRLARKIVTISEFSKRRIVDWSGVSAEKVIKVGCGVDGAFHPGVAPYEMPYPYLLCVSNRKPHKNEFRTVEGFARSGVAPEIHFVFTGNPTAELTNCIQSNGVADRVHFAGMVPDVQLPSLYKSARALVFASRYEGFGLPVVEAMACGTPVVTSNVAAMPEVAGDAGLLVSPNSVDEIGDAIQRVVRDQALHRQLSEKGLAQASLFSICTANPRITQIQGVVKSGLLKAALISSTRPAHRTHENSPAAFINSRK